MEERRSNTVALQQGSLRFVWHAPHVLGTTVQGQLFAADAAKVGAALDEVLRAIEEPVRMYWDLEYIAHYETQVRKAAAEALLRHRKKVLEHHLLATSPLVRMAVSLVNLALRNMHPYRDREQFEALLREAIAADSRSTGER